MRESFWNGKRVLLTGHTGFKGSWLSLWLQSMGARLTGYSLGPPTTPSLFELAGVARDMVSTIGDVRDAPALSAAFRSALPEIVIHMAAQPLVRESYRTPAETYAANVMGTVHLLECVRASTSVRVLVVITTDKCYQDGAERRPYREGDRLGGHDPYASSKACAELVVAAYRSSFFDGTGAAIATARAGNVIGGGDWAVDRLIPDVVRAWMAGEPLRVRHPRAIRPWQHVLDPLAGYLLLAERLWHKGVEFAESWNFGPDGEDSCEVSAVVEKFAELLAWNAGWEQDASLSPRESEWLALDSSKARARLGWTPRLHVDSALSLTAAWYNAYRSGNNVADLTREQILQYSTGA